VITNNEFVHVFATALRRPAVIPTPKVILQILLNEERAKVGTFDNFNTKKTYKLTIQSFLADDTRRAENHTKASC